MVLRTRKFNPPVQNINTVNVECRSSSTARSRQRGFRNVVHRRGSDLRDGKSRARRGIRLRREDSFVKPTKEDNWVLQYDMYYTFVYGIVSCSQYGYPDKGNPNASLNPYHPTSEGHEGALRP